MGLSTNSRICLKIRILLFQDLLIMMSRKYLLSLSLQFPFQNKSEFSFKKENLLAQVQLALLSIKRERKLEKDFLSAIG